MNTCWVVATEVLPRNMAQSRAKQERALGETLGVIIAIISSTLDGFTRKSELLREHCREVGTDFDAIVRSANYNVAIGRDEAEVQERMQAAKARLLPFVGEEKAERSLGAVRGLPACGTPEQIVENLRALEKAGMSYGIFNFAEADYDRSGIELFEREVIPALT